MKDHYFIKFQVLSKHRDLYFVSLFRHPSISTIFLVFCRNTGIFILSLCFDNPVFRQFVYFVETPGFLFCLYVSTTRCFDTVEILVRRNNDMSKHRDDPQ